MKTIGEILENNNSVFAKLIKKTQSANNLTSVFKNMLDTDIIKNCQFISLNNSTINIAVKNTAWATRIRYAIPDMLKILRTQPEFKTAKNIKYFISQSYQVAIPKKKPARLSDKNEILWQEMKNRLNKKLNKIS